MALCYQKKEGKTEIAVNQHVLAVITLCDLLVSTDTCKSSMEQRVGTNRFRYTQREIKIYSGPVLFKHSLKNLKLGLTHKTYLQLWKWKHTCYCFGENQVKENAMQINPYDTSQISSWSKIFALSNNNMRQPQKKNPKIIMSQKNIRLELIRNHHIKFLKNPIIYSKKLELLIRKEAKQFRTNFRECRNTV